MITEKNGRLYIFVIADNGDKITNIMPRGSTVADATERIKFYQSSEYKKNKRITYEAITRAEESRWMAAYNRQTEILEEEEQFGSNSDYDLEYDILDEILEENN